MRTSNRSKALAAAMAVTLVASGGATFTASAQDVTLDWFHVADEPTVPLFEQVAAEFEEANPGVEVNLTQIPVEAYKTAIEVALAADDPPDVWFNWAGEDTARFVREGLVQDLTEAAAQYGWEEDLAGLDGFRVDGTLYGVTNSLEAKFYFYNKALFEEQGVTPPTTFDELLGLCDTFNEAGITPMSMGNSERWQAVHFLSTFNQKIVGEDTIDADYTLRAPEEDLFIDTGYVAALDLMRQMVDRGCFQPGVNATDPGTAWAMFSSGQAAMTYAGTWAIGIFDDAGFAGQYDIFPMPPIEGAVGDQGVLLMAPIGLNISAQSEHPELAAALADLIVSKQTQELVTSTTGRLPTRAVDVQLEPIVQAASDYINAATGSTGWLDTVLDNEVSEVYLNGIQEVIAGARSSEDVIASIREVALRRKAELGR